MTRAEDGCYEQWQLVAFCTILGLSDDCGSVMYVEPRRDLSRPGTR